MSMVVRVLDCRVAAVLVVLLAMPLSSPAAAQSLFSDIFGWAIKPNPSRSAPPYAIPGETSPQRWMSRGRYRTVCVRMCDGYYFPISQSTSRRNFYRDGQRCQARCAGEARLFYMPAGSVEMKHAVDVTGLAYRNTDNAFVYRKKLVKGCMCRHRPWSPEERARHQMSELERSQTAKAGVDSATTDPFKPKTKRATSRRPDWDSVGRLYAEDFGGAVRTATTDPLHRRADRQGAIQVLTKPIAVAPQERPAPVVRPKVGARTFGVGKLWSDEGH